MFWKWIILNFIIVGAASTLAGKKQTRFEKVLGPALVIGGTLIFFAARLAWYESPAVNHAYFIAVDDAGHEHKVPSNYFGATSVTVAQNRLGVPGPIAFPTSTWGTTSSYAAMRAAYNCAFTREQMIPRLKTSPAQVERFVRMHHQAVLERADEKGLISYDRYPHHIWSNPWMFDAFYNLDKRRIVAYRYTVDSVCMTYIDGHPKLHMINQDQMTVPVR